MKIDKNYKGLVKEDNRYVFNGNIMTTENLEIDLDMSLYVTGSIKVADYIIAGEDIEAGEFIKAESTRTLTRPVPTPPPPFGIYMNLFPDVDPAILDYSFKVSRRCFVSPINCGLIPNNIPIFSFFFY